MSANTSLPTDSPWGYHYNGIQPELLSFLPSISQNTPEYSQSSIRPSGHKRALSEGILSTVQTPQSDGHDVDSVDPVNANEFDESVSALSKKLVEGNDPIVAYENQPPKVFATVTRVASTPERLPSANGGGSVTLPFTSQSLFYVPSDGPSVVPTDSQTHRIGEEFDEGLHEQFIDSLSLSQQSRHRSRSDSSHLQTQTLANEAVWWDSVAAVDTAAVNDFLQDAPSGRSSILSSDRFPNTLQNSTTYSRAKNVVSPPPLTGTGQRQQQMLLPDSSEQRTGRTTSSRSGPFPIYHPTAPTPASLSMARSHAPPPGISIPESFGAPNSNTVPSIPILNQPQQHVTNSPRSAHRKGSASLDSSIAFSPSPYGSSGGQPMYPVPGSGNNTQQTSSSTTMTTNTNTTKTIEQDSFLARSSIFVPSVPLAFASNSGKVNSASGASIITTSSERERHPSDARIVPSLLNQPWLDSAANSSAGHHHWASAYNSFGNNHGTSSSSSTPSSQAHTRYIQNSNGIAMRQNDNEDGFETSPPMTKTSHSSSSPSRHAQQQQQQPPPPPPPAAAAQSQRRNLPDTVTQEITKKAELIESASTKAKMKEFFRVLRSNEKRGYGPTVEFALSSLDKLPSRLHWHVYMGLADLAKRHNKLREARKYYATVNISQPYAASGWLEYAKMEEENGKQTRCRQILFAGLSYCPNDESLIMKSIRFLESSGDVCAARSLLSRFVNVNVERAWKIILEGALLEARQGRIEVARAAFAYLMLNVKWYGPVYHEAALFEAKQEAYDRAITIVIAGLKEVPKHGPLWFCLFTYLEITAESIEVREIDRTVMKRDVSAVRSAAQKALRFISRELVWKVYAELAQIENRAGYPDRCREAFHTCILKCPQNLRWKVWMSGARCEIRNGQLEVARSLLCRALTDVPSKARGSVYLESARLEEYAGNIIEARSILQRGRNATHDEWKVHLEMILLEIRRLNHPEALRRARQALETHSATGRLWAVLIQLMKNESEEEQLQVLWKALMKVPKSGEVWCEAARKYLQVDSIKFDLGNARRCLEFAIRFTPQYGDSFVEYLKLELLEHGPDANTDRLEQLCVNAEPNYGAVWSSCRKDSLESVRSVFRRARENLVSELEQDKKQYQRALIQYMNIDTTTEMESNDTLPEDSSSGDGDRKNDGFPSSSFGFRSPLYRESLANQEESPLSSYRRRLPDSALVRLNSTYFTELTSEERLKLIFGV